MRELSTIFPRGFSKEVASHFPFLSLWTNMVHTILFFKEIPVLVQQEIDDDRPVVRRVPEVRNLLRIADGCGVIVGNDPVGNDAVEKRTGAVNVVDAGTASRRGIEIIGMALVNHVDIRRLRQDIVVHQQPGIILRVMRHPIVHA